MNNSLVLFWWYTISRYSLYNLKKLYNCETYNLEAVHSYRSSCIFISACAIRSIFPRIDGKRICFFDSWLSYPLVGRICATFGEIAFVYQLILITKLIANKLSCHKIYPLMNMIMILIVVAQIFCWYGVLYQQNMMHVIEESIWTCSMLTIGFSYLYLSKLIKNDKIYYYFVCAYWISYIYTLFMVFVDIPMYYDRYLEQPETNNVLTLYDSLKDMASCNKISRSYNIWKDEIPWMTGYFMGATYLSIKLIEIHDFIVNHD